MNGRSPRSRFAVRRATASSSITTKRIEPAARPRKAIERVSFTTLRPTRVPTAVGPPPIRPSSSKRPQDGRSPAASNQAGGPLKQKRHKHGTRRERPGRVRQRVTGYGARVPQRTALTLVEGEQFDDMGAAALEPVTRRALSLGWPGQTAPCLHTFRTHPLVAWTSILSSERGSPLLETYLIAIGDAGAAAGTPVALDPWDAHLRHSP